MGGVDRTRDYCLSELGSLVRNLENKEVGERRRWLGWERSAVRVDVGKGIADGMYSEEMKGGLRSAESREEMISWEGRGLKTIIVIYMLFRISV